MLTLKKNCKQTLTSNHSADCCTFGIRITCFVCNMHISLLIVIVFVYILLYTVYVILLVLSFGIVMNQTYQLISCCAVALFSSDAHQWLLIAIKWALRNDCIVLSLQFTGLDIIAEADWGTARTSQQTCKGTVITSSAYSFKDLCEICNKWSTNTHQIPSAPGHFNFLLIKLQYIYHADTNIVFFFGSKY